MLTAGTFRLPGPLAITVAQVDAMSGGRVELGLGAGWYEQEHLAYGIPFPPKLSERRARLEHAAAEMSRRGVRHLVVFEGGEVVGILSMRDIVRVWTSDGATSEMEVPSAAQR